MAFGATGPHERGLQRLTTSDVTGMMVVRVLPIWDDHGTPAKIQDMLSWEDGLQVSQSTVRCIFRSSAIWLFDHENQFYVEPTNHPEFPASCPPSNIGPGVEDGSVLSRRQHGPLSLKRKRNHETHSPYSTPRINTLVT